MKFEEAFDIAFDIEKNRAAEKGAGFIVEPKTAKILAFMWSMLAASGGQIDDMASIDEKNSIVSIPLENKKLKGAAKVKPSENEGLTDGTESS